MQVLRLKRKSSKSCSRASIESSPFTIKALKPKAIKCDPKPQRSRYVWMRRSHLFKSLDCNGKGPHFFEMLQQLPWSKVL